MLPDEYDAWYATPRGLWIGHVSALRIRLERAVPECVPWGGLLLASGEKA
jgi:hypothetical protein